VHTSSCVFSPGITTTVTRKPPGPPCPRLGEYKYKLTSTADGHQCGNPMTSVDRPTCQRRAGRLSKLGVTNRSEVAAAAHRLGIANP
jgi:hypothetical protein